MDELSCVDAIALASGHVKKIKSAGGLAQEVITAANRSPRPISLLHCCELPFADLHQAQNSTEFMAFQQGGPRDQGTWLKSL